MMWAGSLAKPTEDFPWGKPKWRKALKEDGFSPYFFVCHPATP
jgi:hypothetical protein